MIDLKLLWIGDKVKVDSTNKIGTFEGQTNGKVKVKIDHKIHLIDTRDLSLPTEDNQMPEIFFEDEAQIKKPTIKKISTPSEIDLHLEKLNPDFKVSAAEHALDYQLKACEDFIKNAIAAKKYKITIIHGKGEGKLRELVHSLLSSFPEVKMKMLSNKEGATEVLLNY